MGGTAAGRNETKQEVRMTITIHPIVFIIIAVVLAALVIRWSRRKSVVCMPERHLVIRFPFTRGRRGFTVNWTFECFFWSHDKVDRLLAEQKKGKR